MTDRIRAEFEKWATGREFPDLTQSMGRYNRAVVRWMWAAWQEQSERVAGKKHEQQEHIHQPAAEIRAHH